MCILGLVCEIIHCFYDSCVSNWLRRWASLHAFLCSEQFNNWSKIEYIYFGGAYRVLDHSESEIISHLISRDFPFHGICCQGLPLFIMMTFMTMWNAQHSKTVSIYEPPSALYVLSYHMITLDVISSPVNLSEFSWMHMKHLINTTKHA